MLRASALLLLTALSVVDVARGATGDCLTLKLEAQPDQAFTSDYDAWVVRPTTAIPAEHPYSTFGVCGKKTNLVNGPGAFGPWQWSRDGSTVKDSVSCQADPIAPSVGVQFYAPDFPRRGSSNVGVEAPETEVIHFVEGEDGSGFLVLTHDRFNNNDGGHLAVEITITGTTASIPMQHPFGNANPPPECVDIPAVAPDPLTKWQDRTADCVTWNAATRTGKFVSVWDGGSNKGLVLGPIPTGAFTATITYSSIVGLSHFKIGDMQTTTKPRLGLGDFSTAAKASRASTTDKSIKVTLTRTADATCATLCPFQVSTLTAGTPKVKAERCCRSPACCYTNDACSVINEAVGGCSKDTCLIPDSFAPTAAPVVGTVSPTSAPSTQPTGAPTNPIPLSPTPAGAAVPTTGWCGQDATGANKEITMSEPATGQQPRVLKVVEGEDFNLFMPLPMSYSWPETSSFTEQNTFSFFVDDASYLDFKIATMELKIHGLRHTHAGDLKIQIEGPASLGMADILKGDETNGCADDHFGGVYFCAINCAGGNFSSFATPEEYQRSILANNPSYGADYVWKSHSGSSMACDSIAILSQDIAAPMLRKYQGKSGGGVWKVKLADSAPFSDVGFFESISLTFTAVPCDDNVGGCQPFQKMEYWPDVSRTDTASGTSLQYSPDASSTKKVFRGGVLAPGTYDYTPATAVKTEWNVPVDPKATQPNVQGAEINWNAPSLVIDATDTGFPGRDKATKKMYSFAASVQKTGYTPRETYFTPATAKGQWNPASVPTEVVASADDGCVPPWVAPYQVEILTFDDFMPPSNRVSGSTSLATLRLKMKATQKSTPLIGVESRFSNGFRYDWTELFPSKAVANKYKLVLWYWGRLGNWHRLPVPINSFSTSYAFAGTLKSATPYRIALQMVHIESGSAIMGLVSEWGVTCIANCEKCPMGWSSCTQCKDGYYRTSETSKPTFKVKYQLLAGPGAPPATNTNSWPIGTLFSQGEAPNKVTATLGVEISNELATTGDYIGGRGTNIVLDPTSFTINGVSKTAAEAAEKIKSNIITAEKQSTGSAGVLCIGPAGSCSANPVTGTSVAGYNVVQFTPVKTQIKCIKLVIKNGWVDSRTAAQKKESTTACKLAVPPVCDPIWVEPAAPACAENGEYAAFKVDICAANAPLAGPPAPGVPCWTAAQNDPTAKLKGNGKCTCETCKSCPRGQTRTSCGGLSGGACDTCETAKYKAIEGTYTDKCLDCKVCKANEYAASPCIVSSNAVCEACPANSVSLEGSLSKASCKCLRGYYMDVNGNCLKCAGWPYCEKCTDTMCLKCNSRPMDAQGRVCVMYQPIGTGALPDPWFVFAGTITPSKLTGDKCGITPATPDAANPDGYIYPAGVSVRSRLHLNQCVETCQPYDSYAVLTNPFNSRSGLRCQPCESCQAGSERPSCTDDGSRTGTEVLTPGLGFGKGLEPCTSCDTGRYKSIPGTFKTKCEDCQGCEVGSFINIRCNAMSDNTCDLCSTCPKGKERIGCNNTATESGYCVRCAPGTYKNLPGIVGGVPAIPAGPGGFPPATPAVAGKYSPGSYTDICIPCTKCGPTQYTPIDQVCTFERDTGVCLDCSTAQNATSYIAQPCTANNDAVIQMCGSCNPGFFRAGCVGDQPGVCTPCGKGYFKNDYSNAPQCKKRKKCEIDPSEAQTDQKFVKVPGDRTKDTICTSCEDYGDWGTAPGYFLKQEFDGCDDVNASVFTDAVTLGACTAVSTETLPSGSTVANLMDGGKSGFWFTMDLLPSGTSVTMEYFDEATCTPTIPNGMNTLVWEAQLAGNISRADRCTNLTACTVFGLEAADKCTVTDAGRSLLFIQTNSTTVQRTVWGVSSKCVVPSFARSSLSPLVYSLISLFFFFFFSLLFYRTHLSHSFIAARAKRKVLHRRAGCAPRRSCAAPLRAETPWLTWKDRASSSLRAISTPTPRAV